MTRLGIDSDIIDNIILISKQKDRNYITFQDIVGYLIKFHPRRLITKKMFEDIAKSNDSLLAYKHDYSKVYFNIDNIPKNTANNKCIIYKNT